MRKRHAARPTLEAVEDRLVLNAAGMLDPTAQLRAALTGLIAHHSHASPALAKHHAAAHGARSVAGTAHHHTAKAAHHPTHHSSSSSSSGLTGSFSNFFKSIGL